MNIDGCKGRQKKTVLQFVTAILVSRVPGTLHQDILGTLQTRWVYALLSMSTSSATYHHASSPDVGRQRLLRAARPREGTCCPTCRARLAKSSMSHDGQQTTLHKTRARLCIKHEAHRPTDDRKRPRAQRRCPVHSRKRATAPQGMRGCMREVALGPAAHRWRHLQG